VRKYLFYGTYTPKGLRGLVAEGGTSRIDAARKSLESAGGSLEAFYFALGEQDFYIIVNLPDDATAAAVTLAGNVSDTLRIKSAVLLIPEQMDEALKKRVDFRAPGE
jgi:uncharacterized protein with GYD domain